LRTAMGLRLASGLGFFVGFLVYVFWTLNSHICNLSAAILR
jgi:hypothetical protein